MYQRKSPRHTINNRRWKKKRKKGKKNARGNEKHEYFMKLERKCASSIFIFTHFFSLASFPFFFFFFFFFKFGANERKYRRKRRFSVFLLRREKNKCIKNIELDERRKLELFLLMQARSEQCRRAATLYNFMHFPLLLGGGLGEWASAVEGVSRRQNCFQCRVARGNFGFWARGGWGKVKAEREKAPEYKVTRWVRLLTFPP